MAWWSPRFNPSVLNLFALVREALARATWALLNGDRELGESVVDGDQDIDELAADLELLIWSRLESDELNRRSLRELIGTLMLLPELERSADLAEHIAQRALTNVGAEMTPVGRGIVQRMSEVAADMWQSVAAAYVGDDAGGFELDEADEELDILHDRLTNEIAKTGMATTVAAQVTLISRFYERIGDHAVNLSRRIAAFQVATRLPRRARPVTPVACPWCNSRGIGAPRFRPLDLTDRFAMPPASPRAVRLVESAGWSRPVRQRVAGRKRVAQLGVEPTPVEVALGTTSSWISPLFCMTTKRSCVVEPGRAKAASMPSPQAGRPCREGTWRSR